MKNLKHKIVLFPLITLVLIGCFGKSQQTLKNNYDNFTAKIIAVLPVESKTPQNTTAVLLRSKISDEFHFKGFRTIPFNLMEQKMGSSNRDDANWTKSNIDPTVLKDFSGADAGMYCVLTEDSKSYGFFYSPITIAVSCELRSTLTGEKIWNGQSKASSRNFEFTPKRLERKTIEDYETVVDEVVKKLMETMPDGPNLR